LRIRAKKPTYYTPPKISYDILGVV